MNINKYFSLDHMNDSERYWFCYLNRQAERDGFTTRDCAPITSTTFLDHCVEHNQRQDTLKSYFYDSLMVGLHTQEKMTALRAYVQSCEYYGRLQELGESVGHLADAKTTLRHKVEDTMRNR